MEAFFKLLMNYNRKLHSKENLPLWHKIYTEDNPPVYYISLRDQLSDLDKNLSILEIGSGLGDIVALLLSLGFKNVKGVERDKSLSALANKKIKELFGIDEDYIINAEYPINLDFSPDVYIQVNNVYTEGCYTKKEYLNRLNEIINYNGKPKIVFLELIDYSFKEESKHYPDFVKVSELDVANAFNNYSLESSLTYQYPKNTSTKRLYKIKIR